MILIGVPCGEYIKSRTAFDLFNLNTYDVRLTMERGCDVASNRNKLAQRAIDGNYSHLLFIDSDMSFPPDTLARLIKHDKDIVGVAINRRSLPLESNVKPLSKEDVDKPLPTELFEATSVGTGIMLIKTDVFKNLEYPWFDFEYLEGERYGEDVTFCLLAGMKYKIWVDPTIPARHIGEYLY